MVVFDTNFLVLLMQEDPPPVVHPETKAEVANVRERIEYLIERLHKTRTKIIIPTPVLAELLIRFADRTEEIVDVLRQTYRFEFAAFDTAAAIETGMVLFKHRRAGDKKGGSSESWTKVRFDRQIVSIAKSRNAVAVYSTDEQVRKYTEDLGMKAISVWDLDEPPTVQGNLLDWDDSTDSGDAG